MYFAELWQTIRLFSAHTGDALPTYWMPVFSFALIWSALDPAGVLTWVLDMLPALGAAVLLAATQRRFVLTPLSYGLLLALCLLILVGAHYSFGRVPVFEWLKPWLGTERNNFDKLAHFFQGFVPAVVFREVLIRFEAVEKRHWLSVIVLGLCLAFSAAYELVEWGAVPILRERAEDFLAIQGDPWDAQSDMAAALLGAVAAVALLSRLHDRQIARLVVEMERESPVRSIPASRRPPAP
jgi:putative membrane protein